MAAKKFDKHSTFIVLGSYWLKGARVMEFMEVGGLAIVYHQKFTPRSGMYDHLTQYSFGIEDIGTHKYQEFEADWRWHDGEIEINYSTMNPTGRILQMNLVEV
jgi:hypothetical protein